jgi:hypothetical protein
LTTRFFGGGPLGGTTVGFFESAGGSGVVDVLVVEVVEVVVTDACVSPADGACVTPGAVEPPQAAMVVAAASPSGAVRSRLIIGARG